MAREFVSLAVMGIDQHENGVVAVARLLREAQMRVEYLGKLQTPASVAEWACAHDCDVVGVSCHSWEYLELAPQLVRELRRRGSDAPVVIGGSVITETDGEAMKEAGVAAVFTASSNEQDVVDAIRRLAAERRGARGCGER